MPNAPFLAPERDPAFKVGRPKGGGVTYYTIPGGWVVSGTSTSTFVNGNGSDYYSPWVTPTPIIVDQLAIEITTLVSGKNVRIGCYAADTNWQPVGAPLADSGNISTTTTGVKTYTPAVPIYVPRGRYLSVVNNDDGTFALATRRFYNGYGAPFSTSLGTSGPIEYYVARVYAAFPTPGTAWDSVDSGTGAAAHRVVYRVSGP